MFELLPVITAVIGSSIAAYVDIRTTEIPDWSVNSMIGIGIVLYIINFLINGSIMNLFDGMIVGFLGFIFGVILYFLGQWGGGDAKLLAAILFLIPAVPMGLSPSLILPFPISLIINIFLIGAVYIIVYAFIFTLSSETVRKEFLIDIKSKKTISTLISSILVLLLTWIFFMYTFSINNAIILYLIPGTLGLVLLWRLLKTIEKKGFVKKIKVDELKEGDMIGENIPSMDIDKKIIRGLTKKEVQKIKKLRKTVLIKDGVRFGPVFPIAILITILYGDLILLLF